MSKQRSSKSDDLLHTKKRKRRTKSAKKNKKKSKKLTLKRADTGDYSGPLPSIAMIADSHTILTPVPVVNIKNHSLSHHSQSPPPYPNTQSPAANYYYVSPKSAAINSVPSGHSHRVHNPGNNNAHKQMPRKPLPSRPMPSRPAPQRPPPPPPPHNNHPMYYGGGSFNHQNHPQNHPQNYQNQSANYQQYHQNNMNYHPGMPTSKSVSNFNVMKPILRSNSRSNSKSVWVPPQTLQKQQSMSNVSNHSEHSRRRSTSLDECGAHRIRNHPNMNMNSTMVYSWVSTTQTPQYVNGGQAGTYSLTSYEKPLRIATPVHEDEQNTAGIISFTSFANNYQHEDYHASASQVSQISGQRSYSRNIIAKHAMDENDVYDYVNGVSQPYQPSQPYQSSEPYQPYQPLEYNNNTNNVDFPVNNELVANDMLPSLFGKAKSYHHDSIPQIDNEDDYDDDVPSLKGNEQFPMVRGNSHRAYKSKREMGFERQHSVSHVKTISKSSMTIESKKKKLKHRVRRNSDSELRNPDSPYNNGSGKITPEFPADEFRSHSRKNSRKHSRKKKSKKKNDSTAPLKRASTVACVQKKKKSKRKKSHKLHKSINVVPMRIDTNMEEEKKSQRRSSANNNRHKSSANTNRHKSDMSALALGLKPINVTPDPSDDDDEEITPNPNNTVQFRDKKSEPMPQPVSTLKKRRRRNSESVVNTPVDSPIISGCSFVEAIKKSPQTRKANEGKSKKFSYRKRKSEYIIAAENKNDHSNESDNERNNNNNNNNDDRRSQSSNKRQSLDANMHFKNKLSFVDDDLEKEPNVVLPYEEEKMSYNDRVLNKHKQHTRKIKHKNDNSRNKHVKQQKQQPLIVYDDTVEVPDDDNALFDHPLPSKMYNAPPKRVSFPPKCVQIQHKSNTKIIDKLLQLPTHKWNFERKNDCVDVFREQCKSVAYENYVPAVKDVMYPTMISSLALPSSSKERRYTMAVKYTMSQFLSAEKDIQKHSPMPDHVDDTNGKRNSIMDRLYQLHFDFSYKTTVSMVIEDLVHKVKKSLNDKYREYIQKLHLKCFYLKMCGREEYLKNDSSNNTIMSLSYIRNCIRQNEVHNMEMVLMYDDSLRKYDDTFMRQSLRKSYDEYYYNVQSTESSLEYEKSGFNCIGRTLKATIGNRSSQNLDQLYTDVEDEMQWQYDVTGSMFEDDDTPLGFGNAHSSQKKGMNTPIYTPISSQFHSWTLTKEAVTDFNALNRDMLCLQEFISPIKLTVGSIHNLTICPRFRVQMNQYSTYVLRIELMFGLHVFEEACWDISIPKSFISNNIQIPVHSCHFSTEKSKLNYSSLPREAVWCFTIYGVKRDREIEEEMARKERKKKKKQQKDKPKILDEFLSRQNTSENLQHNTGNPFRKRKSKDIPIMENISATTASSNLNAQMVQKTDLRNDFYNKQHTGRSQASTRQRMDTGRSMKGRHFFSGDEEQKSDNNDQPLSQFKSEPIAWCRMPMVDQRHCLRKGHYTLKLWTVPVFEKVKGGPKIDPYLTNNWKKFGSFRDCDLNKTNKSTTVTLKIQFEGKHKFDVVAPICNQRRPKDLEKIKIWKRKEFSGKKLLYNIILKDGILPLDETEVMLVRSNKEKLMRDASTIPTYLRSVSWLDQDSRMEAYDYLQKWIRPQHPEDMIELLRYEFADNRIRLYAINCLNQLDDYALNRCLLQLVQALKNEQHHSSFLARFLMIRALNNPFQIGHYLFWHLKSEFHTDNLEWCERSGLLLEEYLKHLPYYPSHPEINLTARLCEQAKLINRLRFISLSIKNAKKKFSSKHLTNLLHMELKRINEEYFNDDRTMTLSLNPSFKVGRIMYHKCKFMSSAQVPLFLVFENGDIYSDQSIKILFKCGDDLRQDILVMQLFKLMDAFWLEQDYDLNMKTYEVTGTGNQVGMIEIVEDSRTVNDIGSLKQKSHYKYIQQKTPMNAHLTLEQKQLNYARSCAGYSVATWCLGIGDRHSDNIMIHQNGTLFHIDFGHILGNFKEKKIVGMNFQREKTPFVFTTPMKYCIDAGRNNKNYANFVAMLFDAYIEVRKRYKFLLNLMLLMVPSQLPELITESDVGFFRDALRFDLSEHRDIAKHVEGILEMCLSDNTKKLDNTIHKATHWWKGRK